jgi:hypothetical protein
MVFEILNLLLKICYGKLMLKNNSQVEMEIQVDHSDAIVAVEG